jgi:CBS domain containing-hemolysin-like protein
MNTTNLTIELFVLIICSGFFAATETAYSSMNSIKLKSMANRGNKSAVNTLKLAENYSKLITTVLIINNVINILATTLATVLFIQLFGQDLGVSISTVFMTIVLLIFGEITPKSIAKKIPENYAIAVYKIVKIFMIIMTPITFIFDSWVKLVDKIFKFENDDTITSEEIETMVKQAHKFGGLEKDESNLIINAIKFDDQIVKEILTPRVEIIAIDINTSIKEIDRIYRESGYTRLPVYENSIDNIVGVLNEKEFYHMYVDNKDFKIKNIVKNILYTTSNVLIDDLLRKLQANKLHLAIVVDEYGGTIGLVTMEDILEELVGEIYDEHDEIVQYYEKINDNEYIVNADVDVDDFFNYFKLKEDLTIKSITLSGWLMNRNGIMPKQNSIFNYQNISITIIEINEKKIKHIKVTKL